MNSKSIFLILFAGMLLLSGCEKKMQDKESVPPPNTMTEMPEQKKIDVQKKEINKTSGITEETSKTVDEKIPDVKQQRMIIKIGTMNLEVDKYEDAEYKLNEAVKKYGGYVSNAASNQNAAGKKYGSITLKVPADKFDALTADATAIGKVMSQNIQASDITEEYVDLEARLKTQKELEQRLIKLLNEKASRLAEVIEVEEKLASVRQKIESIEGRMKLLKSQSDLSTLTVSVYEPSLLDTSSGGGFFYELGQAVKKGLKGFTNVLAASITVIIAIIPILIFVVFVIWVIRKIFFKKAKV
ncbi:MAG: DUF4349 domain-containing protein [Ignavibacteria bacterium]|nr:DUF4349 domain-containing protein [Ignavibacteria bacterium]